MVLRKMTLIVELLWAAGVCRRCKLGRLSVVGDEMESRCPLRASWAARASSLRAISSPLGMPRFTPRRNDDGGIIGFVGDSPSLNPQARASKPSARAGVSAPVPHGVGGVDVLAPESAVGAYMPKSVELVRFNIDLDFEMLPSGACNESLDVLLTSGSSCFSALMAFDVGESGFSSEGDGDDEDCVCDCESWKGRRGRGFKMGGEDVYSGGSLVSIVEGVTTTKM